MSGPGQQLAKLRAAADELRPLIREAHEAAKELTAVLKSARTMVDGYAAAQVQAVLDDYVKIAQRNADQWHVDWKADAQRHMDKAAEALSQIVTVVEMNLTTHDAIGPAITADVVIDLRSDSPKWLRGTDPAAIELLAEAPYKVIVGPANNRSADRT